MGKERHGTKIKITHRTFKVQYFVEKKKEINKIRNSRTDRAKIKEKYHF